MRNTQRKHMALVALFLAFSFVLAGISRTARADAVPGVSETNFANDSLSVTSYATPSAMVEPGEAKVQLTLNYFGDAYLEDVKICREDGEVLMEIGRMDAENKSTAVFDETLDLTAEQLDQNGVAYSILYTIYDPYGEPQPRQRTAVATIIKKNAEPKIEFTRTLSSDHVAQGGEVTITYRVRNGGNVPLRNLTLEDALCGLVGELDTLEPGTREVFTQKVRIDHTSLSRPLVKYTYSGSETVYQEELSPLTIYLADERLLVTLDADKAVVSPGEVVTLRLKLVNEGNVTYESMRITDQHLGEIGIIPTELRPGGEYSFSKTINLKTTTTFLFSLSGRNNNGDELEQRSNMLTIAVSPAIENISVKLSAVAKTPSILGPGPVSFTFDIDNQGDLDIRNAVLSEQTRGEIKKLAVLAPGVTSVDCTFDVEGTDTFKFFVDLTDAQNGRLTVVSDPVTVEITQGGEAIDQMLLESGQGADETRLPLLGDSYQLDTRPAFETMMFGVLTLLGVLLLAILLALFIKRRRLRKKRLIHQRRLKRLKRAEQPGKHEMQQTRPHAPVGKKPPGKRDGKK